VFTLTLPLSHDFYGAADAAHQEDRPSRGALAGKLILLVDDDAENLAPIKIFLENEKAEVTPAMTASEALQYLAERDFHVMITDIGMP
jgi:PleD family two-component response regulator